MLVLLYGPARLAHVCSVIKLACFAHSSCVGLLRESIFCYLVSLGGRSFG